MRALAAAPAFALIAGLTLPSAVTPVMRFSDACAVLNQGESELVMQDARAYAVDSSFADLRAAHGVPHVQTDSVQFYSVGAACDSAEIAYRGWRVTHGDSNTVIPVALVRMGGTGVYLGTSLIGRDGYGREYAVLDSIYTVKAVFSFR